MTDFRFSASFDDRLVAPRNNARISKVVEGIAGYAVSLALHALLLFLLIFVVVVGVELPTTAEIPVEIVIESPPLPPPPAEMDTRVKPLSGPPDIADQEKKAKAPKGEFDQNGDGNEEKRDGSPYNGSDMREAETAQPLPQRNDADLAVPTQPTVDFHRKLALGPIGPARGQATVKEPDAAANQDETTITRQEITCGAKARRQIGPTLRLSEGVVVSVVTKDQALATIQRTQQLLDMYLSPDYVDNVRLYVQSMGWNSFAGGVVLLPAGVSVKAGDHVEIIGTRLDPQRPCHYIPSLVLRVL